MPTMLQRDLKPSHVGGQDIGGGPSPLDPGVKRAPDIEEPTGRLQRFASADLREIPVLPEEARLPHDAIDLAALERRVPNDGAESHEAGAAPGAWTGTPNHVLESADADQRPTATAVTRPRDAG